MPNHVHLVVVPSTEVGLRATISETHRRYTRRINFREGWRGHLWQERFHSFPMDESYLLATIRYVELNPVKAKLVPEPQNWRWSSAGVRLGIRADKLVQSEPMRSMISDWPTFWSLSENTGANVEAIRKHTQTGLPLGPSKFIDAAERLSGRMLRPRKPGPKSKSKVKSEKLEFES